MKVIFIVFLQGIYVPLMKAVYEQCVAGKYFSESVSSKET
jgi:hypothetical protein